MAHKTGACRVSLSDKCMSLTSPTETPTESGVLFSNFERMESIVSFSYIATISNSRLTFVNQDETERESVLAFAGSLLKFC